MPLGSLIKEDHLVRRSEHTKAEYESARFRMQALDQELASLKHSLGGNDESKGSLKTGLKKESFRLFDAEGRGFTRRNPFGQVSDCIGSLRWSSQRKYANRMLKIFRRMAMLGKNKSKIKQRASASGSLACGSKSSHETYDC